MTNHDKNTSFAIDTLDSVPLGAQKSVDEWHKEFSHILKAKHNRFDVHCWKNLAISPRIHVCKSPGTLHIFHITLATTICPTYKNHK